MKVIRNSVLFLAMLSPLALAACGEGYEMRPYDKVPYEMERTAGRGIEYVRAGMLPEKGPVLKTVEEKVEVKKTEAIEQDAPPPLPAPESKNENIVEEADHIFTSKQRK